MREYLSLIFGFAGVAFAGIALFWSGGQSFLVTWSHWIGWCVAFILFSVFLIGDQVHKFKLKKIRQTLGDRQRELRSTYRKIAQLEREIADKEEALLGVVRMDNFLLDRLDVTEKATPRNAE